LTTRVISATPFAGSGTKKITSAMTAASKLRPGRAGAWRALLELGDARLWRVRAKASCPSEGRCLALNGRAAVDQQFGEGAIAAANIHPAQAGLWCDPVEKHVARQPAPDSIMRRSGAVVEADLVFSHGLPLRFPCPM